MVVRTHLAILVVSQADGNISVNTGRRVARRAELRPVSRLRSKVKTEGHATVTASETPPQIKRSWRAALEATVRRGVY